MARAPASRTAAGGTAARTSTTTAGTTTEAEWPARSTPTARRGRSARSSTAGASASRTADGGRRCCAINGCAHARTRRYPHRRHAHRPPALCGALRRHPRRHHRRRRGRVRARRHGVRGGCAVLRRARRGGRAAGREPPPRGRRHVALAGSGGLLRDGGSRTIRRLRSRPPHPARGVQGDVAPPRLVVPRLPPAGGRLLPLLRGALPAGGAGGSRCAGAARSGPASPTCRCWPPTCALTCASSAASSTRGCVSSSRRAATRVTWGWTSTPGSSRCRSRWSAAGWCTRRAPIESLERLMGATDIQDSYSRRLLLSQLARCFALLGRCEAARRAVGRGGSSRHPRHASEPGHRLHARRGVAGARRVGRGEAVHRGGAAPGGIGGGSVVADRDRGAHTGSRLLVRAAGRVRRRRGGAGATVRRAPALSRGLVAPSARRPRQRRGGRRVRAHPAAGGGIGAPRARVARGHPGHPAHRPLGAGGRGVPGWNLPGASTSSTMRR